MNRELLAEQMLKFFPLLHRKLLMETKNGKLKRNEFMVLKELVVHDGLPMKSYGERLFISKPNLTKVVDILEKENLLKREADKKDRRVVNLHITKKGKDFMSEHFDYMKKTLASGLERLNEDDAEVLDKSFRAINDVLSKLGNLNDTDFHCIERK